MKTAFLLTILVALSAAAVQQQRSPVYQGPQVTYTGSVTSVNSAPLMKNGHSMPTSSMGPLQPVAEARESVATDASTPQPHAVSPTTPSQNYYVYYYPNQGQAGTDAQPDRSRILNWAGWNDVAAGAGSLVLVAAGSYILYNRYGSQVKARALRELKDLTAEDATRMAQRVLRALEKFSTLNNDTE